MENLLLVINDIALNDKSLEFACYLARVTQSRLQGLLLTKAQEEVPYTEGAGSEVTSVASVKKLPGSLREAAQNDIRQFKKICKKEQIPCVVNCLEGDPLMDAVSESRFADLMVLGGAMSFDADDKQYLSPFVWAFLQVAECPVVIVSDQSSEIDEIVLTYDGSASSLFAFRRFAHLFPCFKNKQIVVVSADRFPEIRHERLIRDQLEEYYPQIEFEVLYTKNFDSKLFDFYRRRSNCFIVMGASGRTNLSEVVSNDKMPLDREAIGHPVFISHF
ncbi:universal stress protein [Niabella beijingensis]|uniref:universal stress protein n=1 Tax=Niabella beijingensis TaxID=2872700 RepID=UPI001CBCD472|nr:universal stress protein [Niabella beijingensis]MBZ4191629.1 universal stress protein [Niabella beijingensis]